MSDVQQFFDKLNQQNEERLGVTTLQPRPVQLEVPETTNAFRDEFNASRQTARQVPRTRLADSQEMQELLLLSEDPEAMMARIDVADGLGQAFNLDPADIYQNYEVYAKDYFGRSDPLTNAESIRQSRELGLLLNEVARLQYKRITRGLTLSERTELDELKAKMPSPDEIQRSIPVRFLKSFLENAPNMGYVMSRSALVGGAAAAPFAVAGAIKGAPMGAKGALGNAALWFAKAFVPATQVASGYFSGTIEAGLMADELYDLVDENGDPIDPRIIKSVSLGVGALSGLLESASMGALLKTIPGLSSVMQKASLDYMKNKLFSQAITKAAMNAAKNYVGNITTEILTEIGQEAVQDAGLMLSKALHEYERPSRQDAIDAWQMVKASGQLDVTDPNRADWKEMPSEEWIEEYIGEREERKFTDEEADNVMARYFEVAISSLILSAGMGLPGTGIQMYTGNRVARANINNAVAEVVAGAPEGATVADMVEAVRQDPRVVAAGVNKRTDVQQLIYDRLDKMLGEEIEAVDVKVAQAPEAAARVDKEMAEREEVRIGLPEGAQSIFDHALERADPQVTLEAYRKYLVQKRTEKLPPVSFKQFAADFNRGFEVAKTATYKSAINNSVTSFRETIQELKNQRDNITDEDAKARFDTYIEKFEKGLEQDEDAYSYLTKEERRTIIDEFMDQRNRLKEELDRDMMDQNREILSPEIKRRQAEIKDLETQIKEISTEGGFVTVATIMEQNIQEQKRLEQNISDIRQRIRDADNARETERAKQLRNELDTMRRKLNAVVAENKGMDNILDIGQRAVSRRARRMADMEAALDRLELHKAELTDPLFRQFAEGEMTTKAVLELLTDPDEDNNITEELIYDIFFSGKEIQQQESMKERVVENVRRGVKNLPINYVKEQAESIMQPVPSTVAYRYKSMIEDMQRLIDPNWRNSKTMEKLSQALDKFMREGPEGMPKKEILDILAKPLNNLTVRDIENIRLQVDILKEIGRQEWKQTQLDRMIKVQRAVDSITDGLLDGQIVKEYQAASQQAKESLGKGKSKFKGAYAMTLTPDRLFDWMEGRRDFKGPLHRLAVTAIREGKAKMLSHLGQRMDAMENMLNEKGYDLKDLVDEVTIADTTLTNEEAMGVWLAAKNTKSLDALLGGNGYTPTQIQAITEYVENNEMLMNIAAQIRKDFAEVHPRLRDALIALTNKDMGYQEYYMPMVRKIEGLDERFQETLLNEIQYGKAGRTKGVDKSFLQARGEYGIGEQRAIRTDLYSLWAELVPKHEQYINMAAPLSDLKAVFADKNVRMTVSAKLGDDFMNIAERYIDVVANPGIARGHDLASRLARQLRRNTTVAYLAGKASIILKQLPSSVFYMAKASPARVLGEIGSFIKNPKAYMEQVGEIDPLIKYRASEVDQIAWQKKMGLTPNDKWHGLQNQMMQGIRWADKLVVATGHMAVFKKALADGASHVEALEQARQVTDMTQPTGMRENMAAIYNVNDMLNWALMFSQQLNRIWNILTYDQTSNIKHRNYGQFVAQTMALSASALMIWSISNRRLPTDEEDILAALGEYVGSSIPLFGKLAVAQIKGYPEQMSPAFKAGVAPVSALKKLYDGDIGGATMETLEALSVLTGAPYSAVKTVAGAVAERDPLFLIFGKPGENR
jgi:hypothetical protein